MPGLGSKFQTSQGYVVRPCLKPADLSKIKVTNNESASLGDHQAGRCLPDVHEALSIPALLNKQAGGDSAQL